MTVQKLRTSKTYRAVVDAPTGFPRWARFVLGPGLIGLGVYLFRTGFPALYSLLLMGCGVWILFPDLDEALALVIGAWKGRSE